MKYTNLAEIPETNLMELLQEDGIFLPADCGGRGVCGKCRVQFLSKAPVPSESDRKLLKKEELEEGWRLACTAAVSGVFSVQFEESEEEMDVAVSFQGGDPAEQAERVHTGETNPGQEGLKAAQGADSGNRKEMEKPETSGGSSAGQKECAVISRKSADAAVGHVAAVDIGTTTIALAVLDSSNGNIIGTKTSVNHQRSYGADVISRIKASNEGKGKLLTKSIREDLSRLAAALQEDPEKINYVISGNTTMQHLLLGYSCKSLGEAPYTPVDISLHTQDNYIMLPGISTYVGADIVSGIVACGMDESEEISVLIDLGTNGEMVIGNREKRMSASTAAGPAFEGGNISCGAAGVPGAIDTVSIQDPEHPHFTTIGGKEAVGICGTGVLETAYELLRSEVMDETGLLDDEYFDDGYPLTDNIRFTGKDIREVQLAKSAIRAGLETLIQAYGTDYEHIARLYLAGGFGQKINLQKAAGIGLLPEELLDRSVAVGNSSLAGAVLYAKNPGLKDRFVRAAEETEEVSLSSNPVFTNYYMEYMFFGTDEEIGNC